MHFRLLKKWKVEFLTFFLPKKCVICREEGLEVCLSCIDEFMPASAFSIQGAEVFPCFFYESGVAKIVRNLKYEGKTQYADLIANFMLKFYGRELKGEAIIPIPISFLKRVKRGYNIPHLIAISLEKTLKIPIQDALVKNQERSQVGLKRAERMQNAKDFFSINEEVDLKGKTVLLIDDTITTGATIQNAVYKLQEMKVGKIKVFSFACRKLEFEYENAN
jgi:competence protein ComFC